MNTELLKQLTDICGVSGDEERAAEFIINYIKPYATSIETDTMGNIIAFKKGVGKSRKTVMVCAHTDEVGFIVTGITDDGYLKFEEVGGIDDRILLAKRVFVGENKVNGVLGIKAVHLQSAGERSSVIKIKDMYIDIGAKDKADAQKYASVGDYVCFNSQFRVLGDKYPKIKAKALDDRLGCLILMELIKNSFENDIYFCFTVQEEAGLRGASVLTRRIQPDVALVFECTTASDVPECDEFMHCTRQGEGPAISIMDRASYSNKNLNKFICKVADENNIKYQFKQTTFGGNDAGAVQTLAGGAQTAVISVPARYIHSPVSTVCISDADGALELGKCVLQYINKYEK